MLVSVVIINVVTLCQSNRNELRLWSQVACLGICLQLRLALGRLGIHLPSLCFHLPIYRMHMVQVSKKGTCRKRSA